MGLIEMRIRRARERPDRLRIAILARLASMTGLSIGITVKLVTGQEMRIRLPDVVSTTVAYEGDFEPEVTYMMRQIVKPGDVFFDVGAHFGLKCLVAASLGAGRIVAFEPAPSNLAMLRKNCGAMDNVTIVNSAVSNSIGRAKMIIYDTMFCGSNTLGERPRLPKQLARKYFRGTVPVELVTIDGFVDKSGLLPRAIKFDVEGHLKQALEGARNTLEVYGPAVIAEVGGYGSKADNDLAVLRGLGYGFWVWGVRGLERDVDGNARERNVLAVRS